MTHMNGAPLTRKPLNSDPKSGVPENQYTVKYYVTYRDGREREVNKIEYVNAERFAGFRNTLGQPSEPGTAAFSATKYPGTRDEYTISGRTEYRRIES